MNTPTHMTSNGGEILPCADDASSEITRCMQCLKDVPLSATLSEEGSDYLHHFCGLDCLETWRQKALQEFPSSSSA